MTPNLREKLDDAIVALRRFKDELDSLDDTRRHAAFALAWPDHPCFETLIEEMGKWSDRMDTPEPNAAFPTPKEDFHVSE